MGCRTALPVHPLTCAVTAWFKSTPPSISDLDCPELQPPAVANSQHLSPVSRQAAVGHLLLPQEPPTDGWAGGFSTKEEACRLVSTHPTIITSFVRMMPFFFAVVVFVLGGGVTFRLVPPPPHRQDRSPPLHPRDGAMTGFGSVKPYVNPTPTVAHTSQCVAWPCGTTAYIGVPYFIRLAGRRRVERDAVIATAGLGKFPGGRCLAFPGGRGSLCSVRLWSFFGVW